MAEWGEVGGRLSFRPGSLASPLRPHARAWAVQGVEESCEMAVSALCVWTKQGKGNLLQGLRRESQHDIESERGYHIPVWCSLYKNALQNNHKTPKTIREHHEYKQWSWTMTSWGSWLSNRVVCVRWDQGKPKRKTWGGEVRLRLVLRNHARSAPTTTATATSTITTSFPRVTACVDRAARLVAASSCGWACSSKATDGRQHMTRTPGSEGKSMRGMDEGSMREAVLGLCVVSEFIFADSITTTTTTITTTTTTTTTTNSSAED